MNNQSLQSSMTDSKFEEDAFRASRCHTKYCKGNMITVNVRWQVKIWQGTKSFSPYYLCSRELGNCVK